MGKDRATDARRGRRPRGLAVSDFGGVSACTRRARFANAATEARTITRMARAPRDRMWLSGRERSSKGEGSVLQAPPPQEGGMAPAIDTSRSASPPARPIEAPPAPKPAIGEDGAAAATHASEEHRVKSLGFYAAAARDRGPGLPFRFAVPHRDRLGEAVRAGGAAELLGMKPTTLASRIRALKLTRRGSPRPRSFRSKLYSG
jgi:hypothetical protein